MQVQDLVGIVPWTFIAQICNLFIQVYLIKRFLFKRKAQPFRRTDADRLCRRRDDCGIHLEPADSRH